jgi:cellulose synthase/poly-beta-1,6-N-acetylglucosamine synthase-like glycosyltransferase
VLVEGRGLFGWFQSLELTGIQSMAAGLMNAHFPITCNGANLAYRRSAFEQAGGFKGVETMVSGDDDLLMQKIARGDTARVVFVMDNETVVRTEAAEHRGQFFSQRARWASKVARYPSIPAVALMAVFFSFFCVIPVWLVLALLQKATFLPLILSFGLKTAGDLLLTGYGVIRTGRPELMLMFPLAEIIHVPYIIGVTLKGFFGSFEWRGRHTGAVSLEYGENTHD